MTEEVFKEELMEAIFEAKAWGQYEYFKVVMHMHLWAIKAGYRGDRSIPVIQAAARKYFADHLWFYLGDTASNKAKTYLHAYLDGPAAQLQAVSASQPPTWTPAPDTTFEAVELPVDQVPGISNAGSWGMARFYRQHLRKLQPGKAVGFRFQDAEAMRLAVWSIKTAAKSIFGAGRTRVKSDRTNLTFYVWLREQPHPEYLPAEPAQQS